MDDVDHQFDRDPDAKPFPNVEHGWGAIAIVADMRPMPPVARHLSRNTFSCLAFSRRPENPEGGRP
jgi:hypothetical protein